MLMRDLGYMKQGINAWLQLDKCAKVCHAGNLAGDHGSDCVLLGRIIPRVRIRELAGQRDLTALAVDVLDHDLDLLANLEDLLRVLNMAPGHLGNMEKSICAAQIDERAKICHILDNALDTVADMNPLEQLLLQFLLALDKKLLAVTDDAASARIELCDNELDLLILVLVKILLICIRHKRCRNEDASAFDHNGKPAGKNLDNRCLEYLMVVEGLLQSLVALLCSQSLVRQNGLTLAIVDLHDLDFHLVANMNLFSEVARFIGILVSCENSV